MKAKNKGIATLAVIIAGLVIALLVGACATRFMQHDGPLEEALEGVVNRTLDGELEVPEGTFEVDFTPASEE